MLKARIEMMIRLAFCLWMVAMIVGCDGSTQPVEMTNDVIEQVRQEDAAVADGESGL